MSDRELRTSDAGALLFTSMALNTAREKFEHWARKGAMPPAGAIDLRSHRPFIYCHTGRGTGFARFGPKVVEAHRMPRVLRDMVTAAVKAGAVRYASAEWRWNEADDDLGPRVVVHVIEGPVSRQLVALWDAERRELGTWVVRWEKVEREDATCVVCRAVKAPGDGRVWLNDDWCLDCATELPSARGLGFFGALVAGLMVGDQWSGMLDAITDDDARVEVREAAEWLMGFNVAGPWHAAPPDSTADGAAGDPPEAD